MAQLINIQGEAEIRSLLAGLPAAVQSVIDKAQNRMAYAIWTAEKDQMQQDLDRPTPWTMRGIRYKKAGVMGGDYYDSSVYGAVVYFADTYGEPGMQSDEYLGVQALGGDTAGPRSTEKQLQAAGLLPAGKIWVPAPAAKLNTYGNLPGPTLKSMLTEVLKSPRGKGPNWSLFGPKGNPKGVMARVEASGESIWAPYIYFVTRKQYQSRLKFYERASREIESKFVGYLDEELRKEIMSK